MLLRVIPVILTVHCLSSPTYLSVTALYALSNVRYDSSDDRVHASAISIIGIMQRLFFRQNSTKKKIKITEDMTVISSFRSLQKNDVQNSSVRKTAQNIHSGRFVMYVASPIFLLFLFCLLICDCRDVIICVNNADGDRYAKKR